MENGTISYFHHSLCQTLKTYNDDLQSYHQDRIQRTNLLNEKLNYIKTYCLRLSLILK